MENDDPLEHTGQAPARRPPADHPEPRGEGELDGPGEGHGSEAEQMETEAKAQRDKKLLAASPPADQLKLNLAKKA